MILFKHKCFFKIKCIRSKQHELFPDITNNLIRDHLQQIEVNSLAEGSTLSNDNDITFLDGEGR